MSNRAKVLVLSLLIFLPFLGSRDFWAPDEPRYAQVAQEMVADGHWWHPHVNGRKYRDKPPLYFWAEAIVSLPFGGVNHWTARLPSVACGLFIVVLLLDLGRRLPLRRGDPEVAATASALAFTTCWLGAWMTRRVNLDVPLAAMALGAVWSAWNAQEAARDGRRSWLWAAAAGAFTAGGIMLKGPVVLLPVVGGTLALMVHRSFREERRPGHDLKGWLAGFGGLALVLTAWLVPAVTIGGYDLFGVFDEHVVERASKGMHHVRPPWYYLEQLPLDFLPWTLLAVPALWTLLRRGAKRSGVDWMLLGGVALPLAVLSLVVEKRNVYILPALPALALIVGRWLAGLEIGERNPRSLRVPAWIGVGLLALIGVGGLVVAIGWTSLAAVDELRGLDGIRLATLGIAVAAIGGALVLIAAAIERKGALTAAWGFALSFGAVLLALFVSLPLANPIKSPREAGEAIAALTRDQPLAVWPTYRSGYVYYSGRTLEERPEREQLVAWLAEQPRPAWVLSFEHEIEDAPLDGDEPPEVAWRGPVGHRVAVLLRYSR